MAGIDDLHLSDAVRKIFLAGVGAVAAGAEKGKDVLDKSKVVIDDLVKKGEITVEQGKVLNQELKHREEEKAKSDETKQSEAPAGQEAPSPDGEKPDLDSLLDKLTPEEIETLKKKLAEREEPEEGTNAE